MTAGVLMQSMAMNRVALTMREFGAERDNFRTHNRFAKPK